MCVWFTLYVWQVFLVLVHFAAVDGESQAFKQHGSLLQFGISVGKQAQRAALGNCNPGWRDKKGRASFKDIKQQDNKLKHNT